MQKVVIKLTSVTYAIRAQKLLERLGIRVNVRKIARSAQMNGCGYGLEINKADLNTALDELDAAGIRVVV